MAMALLSVTATIWQSPQIRKAGIRAVVPAPTPRMPDRAPGGDPQPRRSAKAPPSTTANHHAGAAGQESAARHLTQVGFARSAVTGGAPARGPTGAPRSLHCWQFRWQQDAQRAYVADLRDPWGLDGPPGPRNDDGIACSDLPVDPSRPPSVPAAPHVLPRPVAPPKAALLRPAKRYYGVFTPQAPFVMSEINQLAAATGKTPSSVTFFAGWDQPFRADPILNAWRRGMLPIVSWESRPNKTSMSPGTDNAVDPRYRLSKIIAGDFDRYLDRWAAAVKALGLPIGLRFDHEMNGTWFPWSEQTNGNRPGEFVRAWRHVHDRFAAAGATNVIWIWSPNVIGALKDVSLAGLYPGGAYVDWMGLVGYYRKPIPGKPATFDNTFGESLAALRAVDRKPILLSEVGCTETGGNKPAWIRSLFQALPGQADVIGFSWFNEVVTAIPIGETLPVTNDWRIDSTPRALATFRAGIADPRYGAGRPAGPG